jgi:hypothetical protein
MKSQYLVISTHGIAPPLYNLILAWLANPGWLLKISLQYGFIGSKLPVGEVTRSRDEYHK